MNQKKQKFSKISQANDDQIEQSSVVKPYSQLLYFCDWSLDKQPKYCYIIVIVLLILSLYTLSLIEILEIIKQGLMKFENYYKFFRLQSSVLRTSKKLILLNYILPVVHLLCFTTLLLLNISDQIYGSSQDLITTLAKLKNNYFSIHLADWYVFFGNLLNIFMVVLKFIRLKLIRNYDQVSQYTKLEQILLVSNVFLLYVSQVSIYLVGWSFSAILLNEGLTFGFLKCTLPLLYFTYANFSAEIDSLYGWQTVPIILSITLPINIVLYLFVIVSLVYLLFSKKLLTYKICIGISTFMVIFVVMNSSQLIDYNNSGKEQSPISFLCLAILLVLASIIISKIRQRFLLKSHQNQLIKIFETICQVKGQIPLNSLGFHQYYELYNNLNHLTLSKNEKLSVTVELIISKDHTMLTKNELLELLQAYLDKESKNSTDSNTSALILLIKVRMQLNHSFNSIAEGIFSLSEKFQRDQNKDMYEFMEVFELVMKKFGILKNQDLQTAYALHLNQLHEKFEVQTLEILEKIDEFWKRNAQKQLQMLEIQQSFGRIFVQKQKIDKIYEKLISYDSYKKQRVIMQILGSILNPYKIPKQSSLSVSTQAKQEGTIESMSFIITQNDTIKFVSKDFLKSMGKSNSLIYENVDKIQIFGNELVGFVDNMIKNLSIETQNQWVSVPVICKKSLIKLKKINILWFPTLEVQKKLMIKFSQDQTLARGSFLIYHYQTDTIKYYNQNFLRTFCINEQKFTHRLNNQKIFFNELFVSADQELENIKGRFKVGMKIKCKIYLNKFVEKGGLQIYTVEIQVSNCLKIEGEPAFCVLKIESINYKKNHNSASSNANTESRNNITLGHENLQVLNQKSLEKKYQSEEFFCKLPNMYQGTITQKQSQLEDESRITYLKIMSLFFLLLAVLLTVFWGLETNFLEQRIQEYKKGMSAIQNTSEQYALLYQMYSIAIKRYYLRKYPQQSLIVMKAPASVIQPIYRDGQQQFLDEFLQRYLIQMKNPPNTVIDYKIDFKTFSIKTNSQMTTLMDFAQNFKINIFNNEIQFLLKNYDNFRQLTIDYESAFSFKSNIQNLVSEYEIYLWISFSSVVGFLVLINIILYKIQSVIDLVFGLVEKLEIKTIKEHTKQFDQQKKVMISLFSQSQSSFRLNSNIHGDDLSSYSCFNEQERATIKIDEDKNLDKDKNKNCSSFFIQRSSQYISDNEQVPQKKLINKQKQFVSHDKQIIKEPLLKRLSRKSPFFVLTLVLIAIFFYDHSLMSYEREGITQIYDLNRRFYISLIHIKRQQVDASIIPTLRHFYNNQSIQDRYLRQKVTLVASLPTEIYLQELRSFQGQAFDILNSNICNFSGPYAHVAIKECKDYLGGAVIKGFKSTVDKYIENGKKVANQSLSEFGTYPCTEQKCPSYFEHLFVSILMGETLRTFLKLLGESSDMAFEKMVENCKFRIMLKLISVLLVCICYGFYWRFVKSRCKKALLFFTMIPKSILCSLRMTIYLRKSRFFEKIQMI